MKNRELALKDVEDYIIRFYNGTRRHSHLAGLSPEQFEAGPEIAVTMIHQILGTPSRRVSLVWREALARTAR